VKEFKDRHYALHAARGLPVVCPLTGEPVALEDAHVDHVPPDTFDSLLSRFVAEAGIDPGSVKTTGHGDGEVVLRLADAGLARAWERFHRENARLRVVSRRGNLSVSRKEAIHGME
jgi:hypothetical protein